MKNVLENSKNDNDQDHINKALHSLATLLDNLKLFDKAMEFYQHSFEHKKDAPEFNQESIVHTLQRMADLCTYRSHYSDSLTFYEKASHYSKDMISSETARVWRGRAKVYSFIGNYKEAIFSYE